MKQGKSIITLVMVVFALTLCVYFGFYVFDTFNDPYSTTHTYEYTHSESTQANGVLIRSEQVLTGENGIVELQCREGEKLAVNQTVAYIYKDAQAQQDSAALEALADEIAVLEDVMNSGTVVDGSARLDEEILEAVVALRSAASEQDFSELDERIHEVKSSILRRSYTYGEDLTVNQLKELLKQLRSEYNSQSSQSAGTYSRVRAKKSGTFSSLVDGLESVLTVDSVRTLTPGALEEILNRDASRVNDPGVVGKLIVNNRWYFAANLPVEVLDTMRVGGNANLRFTGDFDQEVQMRLDYVSPAEGDVATAVFSTDRYLGQTTLLRFQSAELVFNTYSGLRVPKQALRMEKFTTTDEETGDVTEHQMLGVYILIAGRAEFKQVSVITESQDFYVVRSVNESAADALRSGDEVIVRAVGLYDGKLMDV